MSVNIIICLSSKYEVTWRSLSPKCKQTAIAWPIEWNPQILPHGPQIPQLYKSYDQVND